MPKFQVIRKGGTIRLTLPSNIANDLGVLQRSLKLVAEFPDRPAVVLSGIVAVGEGAKRKRKHKEKIERKPRPRRTVGV